MVFWIKTITDSDVPTFLTAAAKDDLTKPLEHRARTYLDVNCSHCHQPAAENNQAIFDARLTTPLDGQMLIYGSISKPLSLTDPFVISPQSVGQSMAHFRLNSLNPNEMMPPLAKNTLDQAGLQLIEDWINSLAPTPPPTPVPGLLGNYYNSSGSDKFQTFEFERIDATVNFDWGSGSPDAGILGTDDFAVRWTGLVTPDYSQSYTFYTRSDDGVRLWINGTQLIDNWTDHAPTVNSGSISLTAGQTATVILEFYERGGGAVIELEWESSSQSRQVIPAGKLSHYPNPANSNCGAGGTSTLVSADFNSNTDGFTYQDDGFRGTNQPGYASGSRTTTNGFNGTGGLEVVLGGINDVDINNMSGGWVETINLASQSDVSISFRYNLIIASEYESNEFGQALMSFDNTLYGTGVDDFIAQINGDGNGGSAQTSGWQTFTLNLNDVSAGNHTLRLGGFNNLKTFNDEITIVRIDDVSLTTTTAANNRPVAIFCAEPTLIGRRGIVDFDATASYDVDGDNLSYSWDFGDGSSGTGSTVSHMYTTSGTYTAKLTVSDGSSCEDEEEIEIVVRPSQAPVAVLEANPTNGSAPSVVVFDGSSSTDPDNPK